MRIKKFLTPAIIVLCIGFIACGSKKETAASFVQKWCDLNAKVKNAPDISAKEKAKRDLYQFENEMDRKYNKDDPIMLEAQELADKCKDVFKER